MGAAAERYVAQWDAAVEQERSRTGSDPLDPDHWTVPWQHDPHRPLDVSLDIIASYVRQDDVVVDVGGGPGRIALPLALRCREVVNVERSPKALGLLEDAAAKAGIANVRSIQGEWMETEGIEGDVVLAIDMLGSNRDVVPFVEKLVVAARRRVIVQARGWRNHVNPSWAELGRLVWDQVWQPYPGFEELLPVLWEMGVHPDVHMVLPHFLTDPPPVAEPLPKTREEIVERLTSLKPEAARARAYLEASFDELYVRTPEGFRPRSLWEVRYPIITWPTAAE